MAMYVSLLVAAPTIPSSESKRVLVLQSAQLAAPTIEIYKQFDELEYKKKERPILYCVPAIKS